MGYPRTLWDGKRLSGYATRSDVERRLAQFGITNVGDIRYVDSGGSEGSGLTPDNPFNTTAQAIDALAANNGDVVVWMPGHAETISAAGGIALDTAGITFLNVGEGADAATFTFSDTASTMTMTAASCSILGFPIFTPSVDSVVSALVISAANCRADVDFLDASDAIEFVRGVLTTAAADNLKLDVRYRGRTGGNACVNAVRLVGVDGARVNLDFYGLASTAVVEFETTACTDVVVTGYAYVSGVTDGSQLVVDTVTGSTWYANIEDGAAGARFSGGSGSAIASDDITAINSALTTIDANQDVGVADAVTNALMRDVVGNKTDAAATGAVSAVESLMAYSKQIVTELQVVDEFHDVPAADATENAQINEVVGNKTDASVYVPGTQNSVAAYTKGTADLQERVVLSATAVMVDNDTLFTVAGGPIKIEALWSECVTGNDATASTVAYKCTPTTGSEQTISGASGSIANAAAGASISLAGTALSTAALYNANGPNLIANPGTVVAPIGTIDIDVAVGSTTGTWRHFLRYKPLAAGVTVT